MPTSNEPVAQEGCELLTQSNLTFLAIFFEYQRLLAFISGLFSVDP